MKHSLRAAVCAAMVSAFSLALGAANKGVTFIGYGLVSGRTLDLSGLAGDLICQLQDGETCIDQATFGGFGSAITYTGHDNVFLAVPDRGPYDGRTDVRYLDRFHFIHMTIDQSAPFPNIRTTLLDTRFLKNERNENFVGSSDAFGPTDRSTLRLDPEGVRVSGNGTFFVSDEYGPYVLEFDRQGHLVRRIDVPAKFAIANPTGDVDAAGNSMELYPDRNKSGRQANRGMEGLAITPDGRTLVGMMQNALIQDNGLNSATPPGRVGLNNRIVTFDLASGETHEYVYTLDGIGAGRGVNELLALNSHEFLVLERDNVTKVPTPPSTSSALPNFKRIYKIDLAKPGLTDVSGVDKLPAGAGLGTIVGVDKSLFIDMLDPAYRIDDTHTIRDVIAEKIEGMAWGPDLEDGRRVLYVLSDNDLYPDLPTQIYAFAIDTSAAGANVVYVPQQIAGPLFPPGQVKKALR